MAYVVGDYVWYRDNLYSVTIIQGANYYAISKSLGKYNYYHHIHSYELIPCKKEVVDVLLAVNN
jgi:hypothetical protein